MIIIKRITLLSFISTASFSSALVTPALPKMASLFQVSEQAITSVVSLFLLGYVIGQLIYGPIANRYGRLSALRMGFMINLVGVLLSLVSIKILSLTLLIGSRFVTAIGSSSGLVCTIILIREYFNDENAKSMLSYAVLSFTLGVGIAILAGGFIIQYLSLSACFYLLGAYGILSLIATYFFTETLTKAQPLHYRQLIHAYFRVLQEKKVIYFSMVLALCSSINYCYSTVSPMIATKLLGLSISDYGLWNGFNISGMFASSILAARLLKIWSPEKVIKLGFVTVLLGLIGFLMISHFQIYSPVLYFTLSFYLFLVSGLFFPAASFLASNAYEKDKASTASIMSFINMGGACLMVICMSLMPFNLLQSLIYTLSILLVILVLAPLKWRLFTDTPTA